MRQLVVCSNCKSPNESTCRFCGTCGSSMDTGCPHCGTPDVSSSGLCPKCGEKVVATENAEEIVTKNPFPRYKFKDVNVNGVSGISYDGNNGGQDVLALVTKAQNGDVNAFGKIYNTYLDRIYRYVYYQVRDKSVAEDLTQEVFTKAWEAIGKFKWKGKPFSSWLYRIAHNHTMDFFRAMQKDNKLVGQTTAEDYDPVLRAEGKLMNEQLKNAISQLNSQQREIIILKFIEGLDNNEISQIMGKSQGAIRVTQMRALAALRQNLAGEIG